jgi:SNF2 family DNA or RNA helicase
MHACVRACVRALWSAQVLCPAICVGNWVAEIKRWTSDSLAAPVTLSHDSDSGDARLKKVRKWRKEGGLLVLSYETWMSLVNGSSPARASRDDSSGGGSGGGGRDEWRALLLDGPGPDLVVLDEGHRIRSRRSGISRAVKVSVCVHRCLDCCVCEMGGILRSCDMLPLLGAAAISRSSCYQ